MEDKNNKENIEEDRKSNSSVLNLSLESTKEVSKDSISSEYKSNLKSELMNEVNLPIENEINATDTTPFILEEKDDEYQQAYHQKLCMRELCENCHFSGRPRVGDISIADFWWIEETYPELKNEQGTSAVLINNDHGRQLFNEMKKQTKKH